MSQTATPTDAAASMLIAFEQNEFDIAGLADFCSEATCVDQCLRQLFQIINRQREPSSADRKLLAQVLVGMLYVARNDYASEGYQEYWPFLFTRIRKAAFADPDRFWSESLAGPQYQSLLGRWFLQALEAFGYSVPDEGQKYVGPIVFHAGMPSTSLPKVMAAIGTACDQFGNQAVSVPADIRSELVRNHFLHRNVERLFSSNLQGASQLWGCLARVVLAWKTLGDCSDELEQLPLALNPDDVRAALPLESENPRVTRAALPQLRYDPDSGEIRLTFPGDSSHDWNVSADRRPILLSWSCTHLGVSAEFHGPLPHKISVEPSKPDGGIGRESTPYPSDWPGFWFHAHNGNLEDGRVIDASGLSSGRWYVIFEGTPTRCSIPFTVQILLKWSWFKGNQDWTAWEVDVPPRSASQSHLEWFVGDNCFRVPLAHRPGPRVEFVDSPIAEAVTTDGNRLLVYAAAPNVILRRELPISLQLLRESTDSVAVIARIDLKPETVARLPVEQAGVYQLRESRGVGRTVLRFAIVPELTIQGPEYDTTNSKVNIRFFADRSAGQISDDVDFEVTSDKGHWNIRSTTIAPLLRVTWYWSNSDIPTLTFRWPLAALRWRIIHAGDEYSEWTREPLIISPTTVRDYDAQLEIQTPLGSDLLINGMLYTGKLQPSPSGNTCIVSLLSYGQTVELENEGHLYGAVLISDRPFVKSFEGYSDRQTVIVTWVGITNCAGMLMLSWDPFDVLSRPKEFTLSESELESSEWMAECNNLPSQEWTSISLARTAGFFQKVHQLAASQSDLLEPVSLLLNRSTGTVKLIVGSPETWPEFLHKISLLRLSRSVIDYETVTNYLSNLVSCNEFDFAGAVRLSTKLEQLLVNPPLSDRDRNWATVIHQGVLATVRRVSREKLGLALSVCNTDDVFVSLLRIGVPLGRFCPFHWLATGDLPAESIPYPLTYIRDLWLLGMPSRLLEHQLQKSGGTLLQQYAQMQSEAASRVLEFHEKFKLPTIAAFLPLSRRNAMAVSTDRQHRHSFALPPFSTSIRTPDELREVLGLEDKALDCQATCDDQFFGRYSRSGQANGGHRRVPVAASSTDYSLYWNAEENRWAIETLNQSPPTCCYTNTHPLVVDPIPAKELANTTVFEALVSWTQEESIAPEQLDALKFLDRYEVVLVSDPTSGPFHAEIFRPSETETKELFGRKIHIETRAGLPRLAKIAWMLAWIDRICAWHREDTVFEQSDDHASIQIEFLGAMADAISQWPRLMQRSLGLAELVYWTLYRGGLGTAVKFRSNQTDEQLSKLEVSPEIGSRAIATPAPPISSTGNSAIEVAGIIVGYDAGIGIVLLHDHRSSSLDAVIQDYLASNDTTQYWFATFKWRSIPESERERIQQSQSRGAGNGKTLRSVTLADVMCGMRVTCDLQKKSNWEAMKVVIDFDFRTAHIPKHRRRHLT